MADATLCCNNAGEMAVGGRVVAHPLVPGRHDAPRLAPGKGLHPLLQQEQLDRPLLGQLPPGGQAGAQARQLPAVRERGGDAARLGGLVQALRAHRARQGVSDFCNKTPAMLADDRHVSGPCCPATHPQRLGAQPLGMEHVSRRAQQRPLPPERRRLQAPVHQQPRRRRAGLALLEVLDD